MSAKDTTVPDHIHVIPVPGAEGNGHKVRPDLQTKIMTTLITLVFLGAIGWVGTKVSDLSDRMTRVETLVEVKLDEVLRRLEKLENGK